MNETRAGASADIYGENGDRKKETLFWVARRPFFIDGGRETADDRGKARSSRRGTGKVIWDVNPRPQRAGSGVRRRHRMLCDLISCFSVVWKRRLVEEEEARTCESRREICCL